MKCKYSKDLQDDASAIILPCPSIPKKKLFFNCLCYLPIVDSCVLFTIKFCSMIQALPAI